MKSSKCIPALTQHTFKWGGSPLVYRNVDHVRMINTPINRSLRNYKRTKGCQSLCMYGDGEHDIVRVFHIPDQMQLPTALLEPCLSDPTALCIKVGDTNDRKHLH